ncbi:MAG: GGDEF domain-containing protein [Actinobacteria bacterium]|nr:GGDEF domain-containing protein [Actinomycetota bacterium]
MAAVIARLTLVVRENQGMLRSSRGEARTDMLTGIGNRRRLIDDFAALPGDPSSTRLLARFDMDGFKRFNDTFGHLEGDALLIRTAARLGEAVAGRGSAYRLGGDEFCVIVRTSVEQAHTDVAALTGLLLETRDGVAVTASAGHAEIPPDGGEVNDVLRIADRRMYAVKHAQQSFAGELGAPIPAPPVGR